VPLLSPVRGVLPAQLLRHGADLDQGVLGVIESSITATRRVRQGSSSSRAIA
jgi:hypothetical protein